MTSASKKESVAELREKKGGQYGEKMVEVVISILQRFLITHYVRKYESLRNINVKFSIFLTFFQFCKYMKSLALCPLVCENIIYIFTFYIVRHFHFSFFNL